MLPYALRYSAAGLRVHPLYEVDPSTQVCECSAGAACVEKQRGKHPRLGGWQEKASTDADEIRVRLEHALELVIDSGPCGVEPSTVVDLTTDQALILRRGKNADRLIKFGA